MNRSDLVLLGHATQLVSAGWTQHADARDADGNRVDPWDAAAVSWSLLETLTVAYERLLGSAGSSVALHDLAGACVVLADVIDSDSLPLWNDASGRSQSDVVLALTEAASRHVPAPPQVPMNWCMSRWWRNEGSLRCIAS
jgi:hypothetical protein